MIGRSPSGELKTTKLLSDNPEHYDDAAIAGIHQLLGLAGDQSLPSALVGSVRMGTTVATNALLERRGEPTALLITRGFGDALRIGSQARPDLFALSIQRPSPLFEAVVEIDERVAVDGEVMQAPDSKTISQQLAELRRRGIRSLAVVCLHAWQHPEHERLIGRLAEPLGFTQISLSHQVSPLIRLIGRGDTTVVDAYLSPVLKKHARRVAEALEGISLSFMKSDGGLTDASRFSGKDAVLSGPAGGVVGSARSAELAGFRRVIGFDMGGTSTDVSHYRGEYERSFETQLAGVRLRTPMLEIHTVAAGGGSCLHFDGQRLRVGPDSAGANPGPACYRRGGPLTITDANVMLGKIQPEHFPAVFGTNGDQRLDSQTVREQFKQLAERMEQATGEARGPEAVAEGFIRIAVTSMAEAIRTISIQRGHNLDGYLLNCFGGAGGQHACLVADALGIDHVLIHPLAGLLSAYGMGLADVTAISEIAVEQALEPGLLAALGDRFETARSALMAEVVDQGIASDRVACRTRARIRYAGTDTALMVDLNDEQDMHDRFIERHRQQFGFVMEDHQLILEALLIEARGRSAHDGDEPEASLEQADKPEAVSETACFFDGSWHEQTPVYERERLEPGQVLSGPAVICEASSTTVLEPGWRAQVNSRRHLILERAAPRRVRDRNDTRADPVRLEVFNHRFRAIAEHMGAVLQKTAWSANIKERLDFSCALFDGQGALVANAPHVPVHLGSMGESVRAVIEAHGDAMQPGDAFLLNDPYRGGTHLPDLTVVSPVFGQHDERLFFIASRAHHADVGGSSPGSMPPDSRSIDEEGVLFSGERIVHDGQLLESFLRERLGSGPLPARNPDQNLSDLRAQIAANARGARELADLMDEYGQAVVAAYMQHVQANAAEQVRRALTRLNDGCWTARMDCGAQVTVAISIDASAGRARIDFSGSSGQQANNFNAPAAVTRACVLYVLRCLVDDDIPLNDGCLEPVDLIIPASSLLNPSHPAAVVAGNVETSQVVANALLAALGKLANGPGSMSNLTFGNQRYQHYETICGGAGAGQGFEGCDAVHVHMTNSHLTDAEILESRFPVRLERFALRAGSGGSGRWRGGHGVVREIRFLQAMTVALLANARQIAPAGLAGGGDGQTGRAWIERNDGRREILKGCQRAELEAGDRLVIETPGGGGFGQADNSD